MGQEDLLGWPSYSCQINDLVGGWIVTTYPHPLSQHDHRPNGEPTKCGYSIADCMIKADATQIAHMLNVHGYVPELPENLIPKFRWVQADYLKGSLRLNPYKEKK